MRTKIIRVGNSRGLRIPKPFLDACAIGDEVDLTVENGHLVARPVRAPRAGWAEAAQLMHERGDDVLLDRDTPTEFDRNEWTW
ncbi:MAG: AbrB/MazE/SpoVT family DNA-binding domain-containing protein [Chloroflexota bacterium]|nr:MAG: AbrB/MazE/SpoVT family DNA-binding domain-containing protein [Chloroflexota bacterium]